VDLLICFVEAEALLEEGNAQKDEEKIIERSKSENRMRVGMMGTTRMEKAGMPSWPNHKLPYYFNSK
jgi:hypothetical protein